MYQEINETTAATPALVKKRKVPRTFEAQLLQASELLGGIQANTEQMIALGFDTDFVSQLHAYYQNTIDTHSEQLAHKARMMEKTRECQVNLENLNVLYRKVRKRIKLELPREAWREYGIVNER